MYNGFLRIFLVVRVKGHEYLSLHPTPKARVSTSWLVSTFWCLSVDAY